MSAQRRSIGHRVARAIDDVKPMSMPAIDVIAEIVALIQIAPRLIDQVAMHPLDQFHRQPIPRLTPGGIRELLAGQTMYRSAGDVTVGDLPNEPAEGIAGCEDRVAKGMIPHAGELIDEIRNKQLRRFIPHASQSQIKASHPWPPVEE